MKQNQSVDYRPTAEKEKQKRGRSIFVVVAFYFLCLFLLFGLIDDRSPNKHFANTQLPQTSQRAALLLLVCSIRLGNGQTLAHKQTLQ